eukprot:10963837-Alexandrium_andersonii.AAC.1
MGGPLLVGAADTTVAFCPGLRAALPQNAPGHGWAARWSHLRALVIFRWPANPPCSFPIVQNTPVPGELPTNARDQRT